MSKKSSVLESLKRLYQCWLVEARFPEGNVVENNYAASLTKATQLRARTARFYANLAAAFESDPETMSFFLNRSLHEGNFTNLIVFFQHAFTERDFSPDIIERLHHIQGHVEEALDQAEQSLKREPPATAEMVFPWILAISETLDGDFILDVIEGLLPRSPVVATSLKTLVIQHMTEVEAFVSSRSTTGEYLVRAQNLRSRAQQISAAL